MGFDIVGIEVAQYYLFRKVLASDRDTLSIAFRGSLQRVDQYNCCQKACDGYDCLFMAPLPFKIFHLRSKSSSEGLRV